MRILMMIHRLADNSPYCFYVHEQAKALREQGHDVTVISCVGTMPMMKRLRPALAQTDKRTPKADVIDGIPVYFPRCLTLGNAGEKLLGIFEKERQVRDFGNGRFCRSLVESAIRRKSVRLGVMDADDLSAYLDPARYSDEELFSLDGNCFTYSAAGEDRAARRIGFLG